MGRARSLDLTVRGFRTDHFDEATVRLAAGGCCHDFAVALHRRTGWPIAAVWKHPLIDGFTIFREPTPRHVFCVAPDGSGVDAEGSRTVDGIVADYTQPMDGAGLVVAEIHGSEADWAAVTERNDWARPLAPREHGTEAADAVISRSESFLSLVETLSGPKLGS